MTRISCEDTLYMDEIAIRRWCNLAAPSFQVSAAVLSHSCQRPSSMVSLLDILCLMKYGRSTCWQ